MNPQDIDVNNILSDFEKLLIKGIWVWGFETEPRRKTVEETANEWKSFWAGRKGSSGTRHAPAVLDDREEDEG